VPYQSLSAIIEPRQRGQTRGSVDSIYSILRRYSTPSGAGRVLPLPPRL